MKITSFEEFKELARRGTFVPVCKEIVADLLTPVSAFLKIAEDADYAFLLESVEGGEHVGRYSFLGKDPFLILRARDGTDDDRARRRRSSESDGRSSRRCARLMADFRSPFVPDLPRFTGGAVGYLGYGAASWFEPVLGDLGDGAGRRRRRRLHAVRHRAGVRSRPAPDPHHRQRAHHGRRRPRVALSVRLREDSVPRARARAQPVASRGRESAGRSTCGRTTRASGSRSRCARRRSTSPPATSIRSCCRSASRPRSSADPFTVYRALRHVNPSPYMYFIRMGGVSVVGSSPEMLVRVEGSRVETHPIAGTRPRGRERRRGHAAGRGAEAQREGARRARDARRSRPQRRRPRLRVRHRCACRSSWGSSASPT